MSTKSTICSGDDYHLFEEIALDDEEPLTHVQLQIERAGMFAVENLLPNKNANVTLAIPTTTMDEIALAWIEKRKLL